MQGMQSCCLGQSKGTLVLLLQAGCGAFSWLNDATRQDKLHQTYVQHVPALPVRRHLLATA